MKLYRLATAEEDEAARYQGDPYREVEACEHGNYAPHIDPYLDHWQKLTSEMEMCDGIPKEDS